MARPNLTRVPEWFHGYINQVKENNLDAALKTQSGYLFKFLKKIPAAKHNYRYAKGKWAIKEVLQHLIDAERVFTYRAMCIARKETINLPGFDENIYADNSKANKRNWNDMVEEFKALRKATELLFLSFDKTQLDTSGTSNNNPIYVNAICFVAVGHVEHHVRILREKYL
jgi:DinB superfamily